MGSTLMDLFIQASNGFQVGSAVNVNFFQWSTCQSTGARNLFIALQIEKIEPSKNKESRVYNDFIYFIDTVYLFQF